MTMKLSLSGDTRSDSIIIINKMNLRHQPTSAQFHQGIVLHIQVVHQQQVHLMHNLIWVLFFNSFLLPSSQCGAYSQQKYKHQCCCVVDCILQILFSLYQISLSFNQSFLQKSEAFQSVHHVIFILCYNVLSVFLPLYLPLSEFVNTGGTI